jgi:cytochrome c biogenesis protein
MKALPAVERRTRVATASPWLTNPTGQLWHTLTSVRLALILILLIAVATLTGTLLDQVPGAVASDPVAYNRWLDGASNRYGVFTDTMARLQLFRVFSSIWFRGLIALLVANIIVCTINRWGSIRAQVFSPRVRMNAVYFDRARLGATFNVTLPTATAAAAVRQGLRSAGYRSLTDDGESVAMYADRFRLSRLGTFLTHLSLVLLLIGAIMGRVWGWKDDQFIVAEGATQQVPLAKNVSVKLEQFQEEWYVEGPPKDFSSDLIIYDNGQEVKRGTTRVNSPLSYKGITFNQAFFGQVAVVEVKDAAGNDVFNEGVPLAWKSNQGNRPVGFIEIPGQQFKGYVVGPEPGTYDAAVPLGTVRLELYDQTTNRTVAIENLPRNQDVQTQGLTFRFLRESQFTGLKVVKDPGVNVVWIASGLMVLGLVMVFWFPHRRLWALCSPREDGGADVRLAAASQRDLGLEKDFEQVTAKVRRALTRRQQDEKKGADHV